MDAARMLWSRDTGTSMLGDELMQHEDEVGALKKRIEDLLADNDSMRLDLWAKDVVIRVLAEKIDQLERED